MTIRPLKRVTNQTRRRAIALRRNATGPEQRLWSVLCRRQLGGLKFRRQHPIEPYIVDFYCASANLVVELDGESHEGRQQYDEVRERHLRKLGLKIMRVTNDDVMENLEGVAEAILREANAAQNEPSPNSLLKNAVAGVCDPGILGDTPASSRPATIFQQAANPSLRGRGI